MRRLVTLVVLLLLARAAASAADKDIISLQRDVALVDDRIRTLQQSTDKKLLALTALLQQTLQRLSEINADNCATLRYIRRTLTGHIARSAFLRRFTRSVKRLTA